MNFSDIIRNNQKSLSEGKLWLLIDAAQQPRLIRNWLENQSTQSVVSLFENTPEKELPLYASPFLYPITANNSKDVEKTITEWLTEANMLTILDTEQSTSSIQKHLQNYFDVMLPDGKAALFRFYDPSITAYIHHLLDKTNYEKLVNKFDHWWYAVNENEFRQLPKNYPERNI